MVILYANIIALFLNVQKLQRDWNYAHSRIVTYNEVPNIAKSWIFNFQVSNLQIHVLIVRLQSCYPINENKFSMVQMLLKIAKPYSTNRFGHMQMYSSVVSLPFNLTSGISHSVHRLLWLSCFCHFSLVSQKKSILMQWVKHSLSVSKQLSLLYAYSNLLLNTSTHLLSHFHKRCALEDTFTESAMVTVNVLLLRVFSSSKHHSIHGEFRL